MKISIVILGLMMFACRQSDSQKIETPQNTTQISVRDTCDDPDANINCSFINMPENLTNTMTIAGENEPGERVIISGKVLKSDGMTPYPNVILYSYQTDNTGHYTKSGAESGAQRWHGHLHGWCRTDAEGYYEIRSICPARYPDNSMPAHIHAALKKPDDSTPEYINDFVFKDDNLVTEKYLSSLTLRGGTGIVDIEKTENTWTGKRDIILK